MSNCFSRKKGRRRIINPALLAITCLCLIALWQPAPAVAESPHLVKELNLVFLHGVGGSAYNLQLLSDKIIEQAAAYISDYEINNPGIKIQINTLQRYYPNYINLAGWADNIASTIDQHFPDKKNLVLIGHSMGGKAALYAVAKNIRNLADRVALVITINSPIKRLDSYYLGGGLSLSDFLASQFLLADKAAYESVGRYDSTEDGKWVGTNKHWLAFISAESAPQSPQFDFQNIDVLPRDMDDGIVPISAQYSDGADVVYYGEYPHGEFSILEKVAAPMAEKVLHYLFGGTLGFSFLRSSGTFEHQAGWLPTTYHWNDIINETLAIRGRLSHTNRLFFMRQQWVDALGGVTSGNIRSRYEVRRAGGLPLLSSIEELRWLSPDNIADGRIYLHTMGFPWSTITLDWSIYQHQLLPAGSHRDHYEIKVLASTPFASVFQASWTTDNSSDMRLQILSKAEGPLRPLKATWSVYSSESRYRSLINEIPAQEAAPGD